VPCVIVKKIGASAAVVIPNALAREMQLNGGRHWT
jgi:antitoxin component of MazEF toxin-antitoxin module